LKDRRPKTTSFVLCHSSGNKCSLTIPVQELSHHILLKVVGGTFRVLYSLLLQLVSSKLASSDGKSVIFF